MKSTADDDLSVEMCITLFIGNHGNHGTRRFESRLFEERLIRFAKTKNAAEFIFRLVVDSNLYTLTAPGLFWHSFFPLLSLVLVPSPLSLFFSFVLFISPLSFGFPFSLFSLSLFSFLVVNRTTSSRGNTYARAWRLLLRSCYAHNNWLNGLPRGNNVKHVLALSRLAAEDAHSHYL